MQVAKSLVEFQMSGHVTSTGGGRRDDDELFQRYMRSSDNGTAHDMRRRRHSHDTQEVVYEHETGNCSIEYSAVRICPDV